VKIQSAIHCRIVLLVVLFSLVPLSLFAKESGWKFGIIGEYGFGESSYELQVNDGTDSVRSLLVFPLDTAYIGIEAEKEDLSGSRRFTVKVLTNLTPPASKMIDEDWLDLNDASEPEYIYTESNLEYRSFDLNLQGNWQLREFPDFRLFFGAGYRLLWAYQLITDFKGYKLYDTDQDGSIDSQTTIPYTKKDAIDYSIIYHIIDAGLLAEAMIGKNASISIAAAPSVGLVLDRDDHLLRSKLSTGRGFGYGFSFAAAMELHGSRRSRSFTPYLRIFGSYRWFFSPGQQRQYWYDDADGVSEGTEYDGLVHDVELIDPRLGISAGARF
jgi:hypothetical protein